MKVAKANVLFESDQVIGGNIVIISPELLQEKK